MFSKPNFLFCTIKPFCIFNFPLDFQNNFWFLVFKLFQNKRRWWSSRSSGPHSPPGPKLVRFSHQTPRDRSSFSPPLYITLSFSVYLLFLYGFFHCLPPPVSNIFGMYLDCPPLFLLLLILCFFSLTLWIQLGIDFCYTSYKKSEMSL